MASSDSPSQENGSTLGALLTRLRNERGLVQKQVAQLAGIDGSTLSRLEHGDRGASREVLEQISTALGLDTRERLDLLVAARVLTEADARLLADPDLVRLAAIFNLPGLAPEDNVRLRQHLELALAYAEARGYGQG